MDNSKCHKCEKEFVESDNIVYCPTCEAYHHLECWENAGGCSNPECSDYVGAPAPQASYVQSQPSTQQQITDAPKKKKLSIMLILLIVFAGVAVLGIPFCFFDDYTIRNLGYAFVALGGICFGVILIIYEIKLLFKATKRTKQKLEETKKLCKLAEAGDTEAQAQVAKIRKKYNVFTAIGTIVFIVVIVIFSNRHKAEEFANNLSSRYTKHTVSASEMIDYGVNPAKYGVKKTILATEKYDYDTIFIIECRSKTIARRAIEECEYVAYDLERSSDEKVIIKRKGNCILVGHEDAVKDALN